MVLYDGLSIRIYELITLLPQNENIIQNKKTEIKTQ